MHTLFHEDFFPGQTFNSRKLTVSQADIIAFASEYDCQPFHVDPEQAKHSFPGRLIASGWHSCALAAKLLVEDLLLKTAGQGSPGIDDLRWMTPLFPGDEISVHVIVEETRQLQSRPKVGLINLRLELLKADGSVSTTLKAPVFVRRRTPGDEPPASIRPAAAKPDIGPPKALQPADLPFAADYQPGTIMELGRHYFSAEEIIHFARQFDPQYFHIDAEAAKNSLFGGLCASGWHTAAGWMRVTSKLFGSLAAKMRAEGRPVPQLGPSPGFNNLKWRKPVFAGDTITYYSELTHVRANASHPGWGLIFNHNTGYNQHGEEVFSFESIVMREMHADTIPG